MQMENETARDRPVVENEIAARQGVEHHGVRYVLAFGLGGAALALGIAALVFIV